MKYLFVDNYRGFQNTFFPIKDVNFLVGENSTGKSSILSLINLMGSPQFWFTQEFSNDEVDLGTFKDIVSITSENRMHFQIGVIEFDEGKEFPIEKQNTFLMTFVQEKGLPAIKDYNFIQKDMQIRITFARKTVKFKIAKIETKKDLSTTLLEVFNHWVKNPAGSGRGYRIFSPKEINLLSRSRLIVVRSILQRLALGEEHEDFDVGDFLSIEFPSFAQQLAWIAPVRSKPERIYSGHKTAFKPEGEHIPQLIKNLLNREQTERDFEDYVHKFGDDSGLFEKIYVKNFGKAITSPFELGVSLSGNRLRISDVGYGVSQSLPIIVELFARSSGHWFAIQQPEVHLHPKAQAALGNLFMDLAVNARKRFFIETHSDYTIDRFRTCYRTNQKAQNISSQVLFFERDKNGNHVYSIPILEDGKFSEDQPTSFREFFINEEINILGL